MRQPHHRSLLLLLSLLATPAFLRAADAPTTLPATQPALLRIGIIGLDTSHSPAFTKLFNNPNATGDLAGFKVVAAFPGGSADIASSRDRVAGFTKALQGLGVEIMPTIPALLEKVDVVLLESVDGRAHLEQLRPVLAAGKPVFIDKPVAASLADALTIDVLARATNTPWFSSSALRYCTDIPTLRKHEKVGDVIGCAAWGPCPLEPTHPDFFWYGIHGVETLYAVMGQGCETVSRAGTADADVATGVWKDGRIGTFRGIRKGKQDYGALVFGSAGIVRSGGFDSYEPLVHQIGRFFRTRQVPVPPEETLELLAFMEAADESKRQGGNPVKIADVMAKAKSAAAERAGK